MHLPLSPERLYLCGLVIAAGACSLPGRHAPLPHAARQTMVLSPTCRAGGPTRVQWLESNDTVAVMRLVGAYTARVVTTEGLPTEPRAARLRLYRTDSAETFYKPALNPQRRLAQPLTAMLSWGTDAAEDGRLAGILLRFRRGTLVRDDSRPCFDCAAMQLRIEWTSEGSFGGSWNSAFGGLLVEGTDGDWHSGAAGYFCAWRTVEGGERQPPGA